MIRLFAALAVPGAVAQGLGACQSGLAGAHWHEPEALHITLRFFGEVDQTVAEDLDTELAKLAARGQALTLSIDGVGVFNQGERLNAVWAALRPNEALNILAGRCEAAARRAGLAPDKRKYMPHITLAYLKNTPPAAVTAWLAEHALLRSDPFSVRQFGLYSSWRTPQGTH